MTLRRTGAALALPLALSLAACGGDDDSKSDAESASASQQTESPDADASEAPAPTASSDGDDTSTSSPSQGPAVGASEPGASISAKEFGALLAAAFDKATTAKVAMTTESDQFSTSFSGDIDFTQDEPELAITMSGGALPDGTEGDVRLVDGALYMNTGMSGGKFVKIPAEQTAGMGLDLSALDPSSTVDVFTKAAKSIEYAGQEDVDGDAFHRYSMKLDPARMKIDKSVLAQYPKTIDYDIWFRRREAGPQIAMKIGKLGGTTVTYDAWGAPVKITAPPASDVIERPDMPDSPQG
ncbi:hypothetical protein [Nocardioides daphniae]|uniref:LppX_LprAFG lipoprotein n=1 Tax=Nocardioides daphniae TaxID=402297 RepID=A0A4P7UF47_9ACTN|nr:hypothetical protein [Nocardioides daphniae]QCC77489.1 hypothetical protein E2C04_10455 [Nocardioides daphniae]